MNIYMLWSRYGGCGYVRQFLPMKYNNWTGDYLKLGEERDKREKAKEMIASDIIVAHRLDDVGKINFIDKMQLDGKKLVVDNDDTTLIDEMGSLKKFMVYQGLVHSSIKKADLVTCSTEFLKKEYENYTDSPVVVLPNCVEPSAYPNSKHKQHKKVRIGFIGSVMYKEDRGAIQDLIVELSKREDVTVVCFGLIPPMLRKNNKDFYEGMKEDCDFWDTIDCEWTPFTPIEKYIDTINDLDIDIAVMARKDNYFNRCKSNIKYLEMSMLKIPCICQSFKDNQSPYDNDIIDGWNGYLAEDEDEFRNRIEELIRFPNVRNRIRRNAFKYVKENYDIKNKAHLWKEAYNQIKYKHCLWEKKL